MIKPGDLEAESRVPLGATKEQGAEVADGGEKEDQGQSRLGSLKLDEKEEKLQEDKTNESKADNLNEMPILSISTNSELRDFFLRNHGNVTTCLCENEQDLEIAKSLLESIDIDFDLYCPLEPYKHPSDVIIKFFKKVKDERKGKYCNPLHC